VGPWRVVVSVAVAAGLGLGAVGARASQAAAPSAAPCSVAALGAAFTGPLTLASMQRHGCAGGWAFAWATVGSGQAEVGVTEVLEYDATSGAWAFADRATVCAPGLLPDEVYRLGCFSN
jgi:hypothetical protein